MTPLDVVYIVKPGDNNPELRYSLRSLANMPHGAVYMVGHKPKWVQGVEHIPGNALTVKEHNVHDNLRRACAALNADRFIVMNDDFYVMQPVRALTAAHRGSLAQHVAKLDLKTSWGRSLAVTFAVLIKEGFVDPLSYELHRPVLMERDKLAEVLEIGLEQETWPQWRTMYGNWWKVRANVAPDVKLRTSAQGIPTGPFVSTDDHTFRLLRPYLDAVFPSAGRYERHGTPLAETRRLRAVAA